MKFNRPQQTKKKRHTHKSMHTHQTHKEIISNLFIEDFYDFIMKRNRNSIFHQSNSYLMWSKRNQSKQEEKTHTQFRF